VETRIPDVNPDSRIVRFSSLRLNEFAIEQALEKLRSLGGQISTNSLPGNWGGCFETNSFGRTMAFGACDSMRGYPCAFSWHRLSAIVPCKFETGPDKRRVFCTESGGKP
jgi:hypothetical protein